MSFTIRPFAECLDALQASQPDNELREGSPEHYETATAHSFEPLEWTDNPPITSIYLQKPSAKLIDDPKKLVDYSNFGNALSTWNSNVTGSWAGEAGDWIFANCELVQEQAEEDDFGEEGPGDYVSVIFAMWRVEEGVACGIFKSRESDLAVKVMGLASRPSTQSFTGWYGE